MDLSPYFSPVSLFHHDAELQSEKNKIASFAEIFTEEDGFPEIEGAAIALIGVSEDRGALENKGCADGADQVRGYFYNLYSHWNGLKLTDLGNIKQGNSIDDTYFAVKEVVSYLLSQNILPIILGGSQDLTYANYLAYEHIGKVINFASVDPLFDIGHDEFELNSRSFLSRIILHQPNYLFNYTNIGYQSYYVDHDAVILIKNLYFDAHRLGNVRSNMEESEPMIRNADFVSFDISSIRQSDAPGTFYANPNGFLGEEACRICRYAGMSDKLTSIGFYEYNPKFDIQGRTAKLISQMIWYFIDGYMNRAADLPDEVSDNYIRFMVNIDGFNDQMVFLKSKRTERWWMVVQSPNHIGERYRRHQFVPCSYADYQSAMNQEIPDRWWKVQQKLM
jgi:arginase family enzyme